MVHKVILLIESSREFDRGLLRGLSRFAQCHGPWNFYWIPPSFVKSRVKAQKRELQRLKDWGAQGIIARHLIIDIDEIISLGLPTIISSHLQRTIPNVANIVVDNVKAGQMAAAHLLERTFRNFAFCDYRDFFWSRESYEGFRDAISEAGFETHYYQWPKIISKRLWDSEQHILAQWLKSLPKPVGIFACVDERSWDVNEACRIAGLFVPGEVAIIGYSNDEFLCELSNPPLTSINIGTESAGYEAAKLLNNMMTESTQTYQTVIATPTHVVTRTSTDIMAVDDPEVAKAICFIRENARNPIQVQDVVEHLNVGRTVLYNKFRNAIGCSISHEIKRIRSEQISVMLTNPQLSIGQIALEMKMEPDHLARYFSSAKGMSPQAFRKQIIK